MFSVFSDLFLFSVFTSRPLFREGAGRKDGKVNRNKSELTNEQTQENRTKTIRFLTEDLSYLGDFLYLCSLNKKISCDES